METSDTSSVEAVTDTVAEAAEQRIGSPTDVLKLPWDREAAIGGAAARLRASGAFADVRIVCHDGVAVHAHQAVLAPLSPFLAGLFRARRCCVCAGAECTAAGSGAPADEVALLLPWASAAAVSTLLGLFYTGEAALAGDRERRELRAAAAALGLALPASVQQALRHVNRKRKAEEELARQAKKCNNSFGPDGAFGCWRCGASYATERSLHAHSVLCSKKQRRPVLEEPEKKSVELPVIEGDGDGDDADGEGVTRVITEVTLERIQVKEEPLDSDGNLVRLHTCRYCLDAFSARAALLRHLCLDHFRPHLRQAYGHLSACPECGMDVSRWGQDGLLVHVGVEHGVVARYVELCQESPSDLCCPHCDSAHDDPEMLLLHLASEHYRGRLERSFPRSSRCPMCGEEGLLRGDGDADGGSFFYLHLVRRHFALFGVLPRRVADQLLRVMTDEMLEAREEYGTHAAATAAVDDDAVNESLNVDDAPIEALNLTCPVCERSFAVRAELEEDLARHYAPHLRRLFGSNLGGRCPFCRRRGMGADEAVLAHIAVQHQQLRRVLPKEVARSLANCGLSWAGQGPAVSVSTGQTPAEGEHDGGDGQSPPPPVIQSQRRTEQPPSAPATPPPPPPPTAEGDEPTPSLLPSLSKEQDGTITCPACQQVISVWSFNRHLAKMHLQSEVSPYVNPENHQCRICHAILSSNRIAMTHVAKQHGFAERWMQEQAKLAKMRQQQQPRGGQSSTAEARSLLPPRSDPAVPPSSPSPSAVAPPPPQLSEAAATFGSVPCPLPGCRARPFHIWSKWKKHIYFHVKDRILQQHPQVDRHCDVCGKRFNQRFETLFHIGMAHNRIFSNLPADLLERLRAGGLTTDPNRREYACPMCTDGTSVVGAYTFKCHLFAHARPRMRASFLRRGNDCSDCGAAFPDFAATVKHVALEHNRFVDFLPEEVVADIREMGFFSASKVPNPNNPQGTPPQKTTVTRRLSSSSNCSGGIAVKLPSSKLGLGITSPFSAATTSVRAAAASPAKTGFRPSSDRWIVEGKTVGASPSTAAGGERVLECPVCGRRDFPVALYLKRHLLGHYMDEFKKLYGHCNRMCPLCECVKCSHTDNLRHIAIVHDKLRDVMPESVVRRLVANRVLSEVTVNPVEPVEEERAEEKVEKKSNAGPEETVDRPRIKVKPMYMEEEKAEDGGPEETVGRPRIKVKPMHKLLERSEEQGPLEEFLEMVMEEEEKKDVEEENKEKLGESSIEKEENKQEKIAEEKEDKSHEDEKMTEDDMGQVDTDKKEETKDNQRERVTIKIPKSLSRRKSEDAQKEEVERDEHKAPEVEPMETETRSENPTGAGNSSAVATDKIGPPLSGLLRKKRGRRRKKKGQAVAKWTRVKVRKFKPIIPTSRVNEENESRPADEKSGEKMAEEKDEGVEDKADQVAEDNEQQVAEGGAVRQSTIMENVDDEVLGQEDDDAEPDAGGEIGSVTTNAFEEASTGKKRRGRRAALRCPTCAARFTGGGAFDLCCHLVTTHLRARLAPSLAGFGGVCPECGARMRSEERFLQHLFVVHGRMAAHPALAPEERAVFDAARGDRRLRLPSEQAAPTPPSAPDGEVESKVDNGDDDEIAPTPPPPPPPPPSSSTPSSSTPSSYGGFLALRRRLFASCRQQLREQFPNLRRRCPLCPAAFSRDDDCLRHVGFAHYRAFDLIEDRAAHQAVLAASPACFPPADGESGLRCPAPHCLFATADAGELRVHATAHYYADLKRRMRLKPSGTFICPTGGCGADSGSSSSSLFDALIHLGWEHGKLCETAPAAVRRALMPDLYSVDVGRCRAAASESVLHRPLQDRRLASLEQLLRHEGLTLSAATDTTEDTMDMLLNY